MKTELITDIKKLIERESVGNESEDDFFAEQLSRLHQIISVDLLHYESDRRKEIGDTINNFINGDEAQKRKMLYFCIDFFDPAAQPKTITQNGEEIQLNTYLHEDDLYKLYQFVKRHESDSTFGETVYNVMDRHNLTAPQVYKGALLRRQDFSRATDPKAKSVTKQIAWQIIIGLHCDMEEADEVLFSAGYIRRNTKFDLTMEYFIKHKNYDIMAINEMLYELGLKLFSCHRQISGK